MKAFLKRICTTLLCLVLLISAAACSAKKDITAPEKVRVLIVPKFEVDAMTGDYLGEAQLFYEKYCPGEEPRLLPHLPETAQFYYNEENGVALLMTGAGKTAAALAMTAVLSDPGYDLTEAYVVSVGCSGGSCDTTTLGDVVIVTGAYDNELGHTADIREFDDPDAEVTWFYDNSYDSTSNKQLDLRLAEQAYEITKDVPLRTTEQSERILSHSFPGEDWRLREPCVLKGAALTGDSYWKGIHGHRNALAIMDTYGSPDPYAVTEMEELTVANTLDCYGIAGSPRFPACGRRSGRFSAGRQPRKAVVCAGCVCRIDRRAGQ